MNQRTGQTLADLNALGSQAANTGVQSTSGTSATSSDAGLFSGLGQSLSDAASQAYADQQQRAADLLRQQQAQASASATKAGQAASSGAVLIALAVAGLALVLYLRK